MRICLFIYIYLFIFFVKGLKKQPTNNLETCHIKITLTQHYFNQFKFIFFLQIYLSPNSLKITFHRNQSDCDLELDEIFRTRQDRWMDMFIYGSV